MEKRKLKELTISSEYVGAFITLLERVDIQTEELRVREQEIFAYKGKEERLNLQLDLARTNAEIFKLLRDCLRYATYEDIPAETSKN